MSALDAAWSVLKSRTFPKPSDQKGAPYGGSKLRRPTPSFDEPLRHKKRTSVTGLSLTPQDRAGSATPLRQAERRELINPQERSGDKPVDLEPQLTEEEHEAERQHALNMMRRGA